MRVVQGLCKCGRKQRSKGRNRYGQQLYDRMCWVCRDQKHAYRRFKGTQCVKCGFVAEHPVQLDVDHIDGNGQNDDPSNLQTLCANCHRLKTQQENDHLKRDKTKRKIHVSL